jgi:hypothetical protein
MTKKLQTTPQPAKWSVLLVWFAAIFSLAIAVVSILWLLGVFATASDGYDTGPRHQLTSEEKDQISTAIASHEKENMDVVYSCINNVEDKCVSPNTTYYPANFDVYEYLRGFSPSARSTVKQVYGKVRTLSDSKTELTTTSGKSYTVSFPAGTKQHFSSSDWNGTDYDLESDDKTMLVTYLEPVGSHSTVIEASQVRASALGYDKIAVYHPDNYDEPWTYNHLFSR